MQTFLTISMVLTMSYTLPQHQQTYPAVHGALISGISQEIVGLGITHGICEVDPAGNGVVHGSCEIYPIQPNPLFSKRGGSFSMDLPELGPMHVNFRKNDVKDYGYIADFVYDGSKASLLPLGLHGQQG